MSRGLYKLIRCDQSITIPRSTNRGCANPAEGPTTTKKKRLPNKGTRKRKIGTSTYVERKKKFIPASTEGRNPTI